jgi:hypothetical protein
MENLINTRMLMHPVNWLIVWTVLMFGAFAFHYIQQRDTTPAHTA